VGADVQVAVAVAVAVNVHDQVKVNVKVNVKAYVIGSDSTNSQTNPRFATLHSPWAKTTEVVT
jgi:hypothetical protein